MVETAFAARCLLRQVRVATLATQDHGQPFASLMTPAVTGDGAILMLLSSLAAHTGHLAREPRCAVIVSGPAENANPQTAPRLTVTGVAERQDDPALRQLWLLYHPYAALYAHFSDFTIWRIKPQTGLFVGGFGKADRLVAADLAIAEDIAMALALAEPDMLGHCNAAHAQAVNELAHAHGGDGQWRMLGVDADGFDLIQDETLLRVAFDMPVQDVAGVRAALVRMLALTRTRW
jgi:putative heme iron utilization protein